MKKFIDPQAKVWFRVLNEDGTAEVEALWAQELGQDRYRIDNSPFFAYRVSLHDIVFAPVHPNEEVPTFQRVLSKSGNRTIRLVFNEPVEAGSSSDEVLRELVSLGCGYEGASRKYIALNIPANVQLSAIRDYLIEHEVTWEYADPTYEEIVGA